MKWHFRLFGFVLLMGLNSLAFCQATMVFRNVEGRDLSLVIPNGYCEIKTETPYGRNWHATLEKNLRGSNRLLLMFASCEELRAAQDNPGYKIRRHGSYMSPTPQGRIIPLAKAQTRAVTLAQMKRDFPASVSGIHKAELENKMRQLDEELVKSTLLNITYLDDNPDGIYVGLGQELEMAGHKIRGMTVIGITQLADLHISINVHADAGPNDNFLSMLNVQKQLMRDLVLRNP